MENTGNQIQERVWLDRGPNHHYDGSAIQPQNFEALTRLWHKSGQMWRPLIHAVQRSPGAGTD